MDEGPEETDDICCTGDRRSRLVDRLFLRICWIITFTVLRLYLKMVYELIYFHNVVLPKALPESLFTSGFHAVVPGGLWSHSAETHCVLI